MKLEDVKIGMPVLVGEVPEDGYNITKRTMMRNVYTVLVVSTGFRGWVDLDTGDLDNHFFRSEWFEPAYSLEVGCKVRVVDCEFPSYDGLEGIVELIDGYIVISTSECNTYKFLPRHLIVIEPAQKKVKKDRFLIFHDIPIAEKFKKGDKVICVNDVDCFAKLVKGRIYTIGFAKYDYSIVGVEGIDYHFNAKRFHLAVKESLPTPPSTHQIHLSIPYQFDDCTITRYTEEHNMEDNKEIYEKLAKQMNDEFVATGHATISGPTVFFKKAGETIVESRTLVVPITKEDRMTLLKAKRITDALGEGITIPNEVDMVITAKFYSVKPRNEPEPENEAD